MTAHIVLPELESSDATPTTFSGRIVDELLRGEIGFDGLVFTDSMRMRAIFFGNPYAATFLTELPTMLLTYDFYDLAEALVARALAGESAVGGRLPIALGDRFPVGHGLERAPRR